MNVRSMPLSSAEPMITEAHVMRVYATISPASHLS